MLRVTKKEAIFFKLFAEMTDKIIEAAYALEDLMTNYNDVPNKVKAIGDLEHECDMHAHKILKQLNAAFITPIDREDIYSITKELDNIADAIDEVAHRFVMYNVQSVKPDSIEIAKLITIATKELKELMNELVHLKISDTLKEKIIEVNRLENVGDEIFRSSVTKLFAEVKDPLEVIKWKGIYSYLEHALDACEEVADIVEGVVMKHA